MTATALSYPPNEFSDRLSPILVKELRQGLRTRLFVGCFILLQVALLFSSIMGLSAAAEDRGDDDLDVLYWVIIAVPLLVILPLSGLGAIGTERKANTLELVFLTRLTSRRILFGKFMAILVQGVLLISASIPYAVFRYFLGEVNLAFELQILALLLFASVMLSGLAVGLSPLPIALTRTVAFLGLLVIMNTGSSLFLIRRYAYGMSGITWSVGATSIVWPVLAGMLVGGLAILLLMWEFGSAHIAPPAENHSTGVRLLALTVLGLAAGLAWWLPRMREEFVVMAIGYVALIAVGIMCETPRNIPSLYQPFIRWGMLGRLAGRLLYPGWPSATLFCVLLGALSMDLCYWNFKPDHPTRFLLSWAVGVGMLLVPMAFLRAVWRRLTRPFLGLFLFQLFCVLAFSLNGLVREFNPNFVGSRIFGFLPTYAFFFSERDVGEWLLSDLRPAAVASGISLVVLLWLARRPWREIRACEDAAAAALQAKRAAS